MAKSDPRDSLRAENSLLQALISAIPPREQGDEDGPATDEIFAGWRGDFDAHTTINDWLIGSTDEELRSRLGVELALLQALLDVAKQDEADAYKSWREAFEYRVSVIEELRAAIPV